MFLNILNTHILVEYSVGCPLAVIKAFPQASIPEIKFLETSSMLELWFQTCIIRSTKATFVIKTISDAMFFISFRRFRVWSIPLLVKNLQILRNYKAIIAFAKAVNCLCIFVHEYTIIVGIPFSYLRLLCSTSLYWCWFIFPWTTSSLPFPYVEMTLQCWMLDSVYEAFRQEIFT